MKNKASELIYIKARAKGASQEKAAAKAGVCRRTGIRAEKDPSVLSEMHRALNRAGATKEKIAETVLEAMDATKVISANVIAKNGEGLIDAHSMTRDFIDVPDYAVRCKAAELAGRFRGDFVEKSEVELKGAMTIRIKSNVKGDDNGS